MNIDRPGRESERDEVIVSGQLKRCANLLCAEMEIPS